MKQNGRQFRASLNKWAKQFSLDMDALARQTAQEMSERVVRDTPVDLGFLRSSWQPSIGSSGTVTLRAAPKDGSAGPPPGASIALKVSEMKAGDTYRLINNAAYAMRIEFGFVGQDSLGRNYNQKGRYFVTRNVKAWPLVVDKIAKELAS